MQKLEQAAAFASCLQPSLPILVDEDADVDVLPSFTGGLGVSDKLWNMVSLNPQLHVWWGKAYFGFKCLGILPGDEPSVRVQFVWMPRATTMWQEDCRDEDELRVHITNNRSPLVEQGVAAFRLSGRPLSTGDVFNIPVAKADAKKKMKMAFDLQWALIRIAALTGGANVDDVGTGMMMMVRREKRCPRSRCRAGWKMSNPACPTTMRMCRWVPMMLVRR